MNLRPPAKVFALLWTLAILAGCTIPGRDLPSLTLLEYDKLLHFTVFVGFGWWWMAALRHPLPRRTAIVVAAGIVYACLTELYQGLLPFERHPDPYDALADTIGTCAGVLLYRLRHRRAV